MATPVYGLDIETDTHVDGLDPTVGAVIAVAVAAADGDIVLGGPEHRLLAELDDLLCGLAPGVIATWNGGRFDLPYLATRSAIAGVPLHLRLEAEPLVGGYRGAWHHHAHIDAYRLYRSDVGPALRVSCSLKSIARLAGLDPVEVDAARVHELSEIDLRTYVASDARCARDLLLRRGAAGLAAIDRLRNLSIASQPLSFTFAL